MRDRFSEMIKAGVASFEEKPIGSFTPTLDPMVKTYNNLWGLLTDTHMSAVDDGYIITGTFVKSQYWEGFKYCGYYGNTNIKLGSGYCNLECMVWTNGYEMKPDLYNGDYVIKLTKRPEPSTEDPNGALVPAEDQCCGTACCPTCPCIYSLGESQIPHPFREFFTPEQTNAICEGWAGGIAEKIANTLNEDKELKGHSFRVSADGQYMIADEKLRIPLNAR